jgi:hypothetical protein
MELMRADEETVVLSVPRGELRLLSASVGEALECVESWEFPTRLGADPDDARRLRSTINAILSDDTMGR